MYPGSVILQTETDIDAHHTLKANSFLEVSFFVFTQKVNQVCGLESPEQDSANQSRPIVVMSPWP